LPLAVLALLGTSSAAFGQVEIPEVTIKASVVDTDGNPVRGASVDTNWSALTGRRLEPSAKAATTDTHGNIEHKFSIYRFPVMLTVIDHVRGIGACKVLTEDPGDTVVELTAKPLARLMVKPKFDGPAPDSVGMYIQMPGEQRVMLGYVKIAGEADLMVPAEDCQIWVYSMQTDSVTKDISMKPGETTIIDDVEMKLSGLAKSIGKQALPLAISETLGVPKDFKLTDLKGKWVLMEFWGFW
jgi:hypothetical protein